MDNSNISIGENDETRNTSALSVGSKKGSDEEEESGNESEGSHEGQISDNEVSIVSITVYSFNLEC